MKIKQVCISNQYGSLCYGIGTYVSGIKISSFTARYDHYPDHAEYYVAAKDADGRMLVEFINVPIVIEYEEE